MRLLIQEETESLEVDALRDMGNGYVRGARSIVEGQKQSCRLALYS